MGDVQVRILGPVEATDGARPLSLGRKKERILLAALTLRAGEVVSLDALIDALWREAQPSSAKNLVQGYVSRLRTLLGRDVLRTKPPGYVLEVSEEQIDARRFEALLDAARRSLTDSPDRAAALLREGLALWRGPALGDLVDEPCVEQEARRLDDLRRAAQEERIDADLARGRHDEVIVELQELVAGDPLRETNWERLALALYRAGRQVDALDAIRSAASLVREELGLDPGPGLRQLEEAILTRDPSLDLPSVGRPEPGNLPAATTPLIGRTKELAYIESVLCERRLVTVTGPGGSGKTRLAVEAAARVANRFFDGVWFVDLSPIREPNLVARRLSLVLDVRPEPGRPLTEVLLSYLRGRKALIVLDNCEHVVEAAAALAAQLAEGCRDVSVLATSREPLRSPGETVVSLTGLGLPALGETRPEDVAASEAARLFIERAGMAGRPFAVDETNATLVATICRSLDGLPLALELAAARTRTLGPKEIVVRLEDRLRLLDRGARSAPERHRSLRTAIDWSYDLLPERERIVFEELAVFPGTFSLAGVEELVGEHVGGSASVFEELVDKSLVARATDGASGTRYRLLDTVRAYAFARLADRGAADRARRSHARFVTDLVTGAELFGSIPFPHADSPRRMALFDEHRDDVRAALEWSFNGGDVESGLRIASVSWWVWYLRGAIDEGRSWLERALHERGTRDDEVARDLLWGAGWIYATQGDFAAAERVGRDLLEIATRFGDDRRRGVALYGLARMEWANGRYREARELAESSLDALTEYRWFAIAARAFLAQILRDQGDMQAASDVLEVALVHASDIGEPYRLGVVFDFKASLELARGLHGSARAASVDALRFYRLIGYQEGIVSALETLALVALTEGDRAAAGRALRDGLVLARRLGHASAIATAFDGLARVAEGDGYAEAAARLLGSAEAVRQGIGATISLADRSLRDATIDRLQVTMGRDELAAQLRRGRTATIEEAMRTAMASP